MKELLKVQQGPVNGCQGNGNGVIPPPPFYFHTFYVSPQLASIILK